MSEDAPTVAAFFRGLNVGGRRVKMDRLCAILSDLGLVGPRSLLASGNVVFETDGSDRDAIERLVEDGLRKSLGYGVDTFVRSGTEIRKVATGPFRDVPLSDEDRIHVLFLKRAAPAAAVERMRGLVPSDDQIETGDLEVFWLRRGRLMDAGIPDPTTLGGSDCVPATMRTLNTVRRLADKFFSG